MPLHKFSLQFAFSWSVYFPNRTESYSSQIKFAGPHGITENHACACPRARGRSRRRLILLSATRRQRRKVDKCRVADKKKTDKQADKQINTHYSFIGIDIYIYIQNGLSYAARTITIRLSAPNTTRYAGWR